jgi:hypothetical protein
VVFRRICALVALLIVAGACTPQNNPPQTASAAAADRPQYDHARARSSAKSAPAYPAPALQAFVDRVGQGLVARAGIDGSYRFYVLISRQPTPTRSARATSCHARPACPARRRGRACGGLGHELGHITERTPPSASASAAGVLDAAVDAA